VYPLVFLCHIHSNFPAPETHYGGSAGYYFSAAALSGGGKFFEVFYGNLLNFLILFVILILFLAFLCAYFRSLRSN
jgi:hypothetical protein